MPSSNKSRYQFATVSRQQTKEANDRVLFTEDDTSLGFEVSRWKRRGRGVKTTRDFAKGAWLLEYVGEVITQEEWERREKPSGSYIFEYKHREKRMYVDASQETGRLGRLVNHSQLRMNCVMKKIIQKNKPHLVLVATTDIPCGTEILYSYNDSDSTTIAENPWLSRKYEEEEDPDIEEGEEEENEKR